jgi:hypothetical protein
MPLSTAIDGSPGVVSTLALAVTRPARTRTRSVKVPPMSTAILVAAGPAACAVISIAGSRRTLS